MVDQVVAATYARLLGGARAVCDSCPGYDPSSRAWNEGDLIHLCPVNFLDPVNGGVTSQAGTIAHEVSHRLMAMRYRRRTSPTLEIAQRHMRSIGRAQCEAARTMNTSS